MSVSLNTNYLKKPKILIFTHSGGGGHEAAAAAVKKALEKDYKVHITRPLAKLTGDNLFNYLQKKGYNNLLRVLTKTQRLCEITLAPLQERPLITKAIKRHKPDLIISVFPIGNYLIQREAAKKHIPFLILPTDLEASHFFHFIRSPNPKYFKIGLAFDDKRLKDQLRGNRIIGQLKDEHFVVTGYPLRPEFSKPPTEKQLQKLRSKLKIKPEDKVVLIMMGAQGAGSTILKDAIRIANSKAPSKRPPFSIKVICLCGNKKELIPALKLIHKQRKNPLISIQGLPKQEAADIAALMYTADCIITKPGGSTINETFATQLPSLLHCEGVRAAPWEGYNAWYAKHKRLGKRIISSCFLEQLYDTLSSPKKTRTLKCPGRDFAKHIQITTHNMILDARNTT